MISIRSKPLFNDSLVLNASATRTKNDYAAVILTKENGELYRLSDSFDKSETSAEAGLEFSRGPNTWTLSYGQTVGDSPYSFKGGTLAYSRAFFGNTSAIGGEWVSNTQDLPVTFYDDPSDGFQSKARPDSLRTRKISVWFEQILSEKWKIHSRLLEGQRSDRPEHLGVELRNAYALTDRWFARFDIGYLAEQRRQALRDERGYFDIYWLELQTTLEPLYGFLVTASAGTTVERETIPDSRPQGLRARRSQYGLDVYGLRLNYKGRRWTAGLLGQVGTSNTSYRSTSYGGHFIWEI